MAIIRTNAIYSGVEPGIKTLSGTATYNLKRYAIAGNRIFMRTSSTEQLTVIDLDKNSVYLASVTSGNNSEDGIATVSDSLYLIGSHSAPYQVWKAKSLLTSPIEFEESGRFATTTPHHGTYTNAGGFILRAGGLNDSSWTIPTAAVEIFDPSTRGTTNLPNLSIGSYGHAMITLNDELFLFGGKTASGSDVSRCHRISVSAKTTTRLADVPFFLPAYNFSNIVCASGDKIYLGQTNTYLVEYSISANSFKKLPITGVASFSSTAGVAVANGELYLLGVQDASGWGTNTYVVNKVTGAATLLPWRLTEGRREPLCVTIGNKIAVIGGMRGNGSPITSVEVLTLPD